MLQYVQSATTQCDIAEDQNDLHARLFYLGYDTVDIIFQYRFN